MTYHRSPTYFKIMIGEIGENIVITGDHLDEFFLDEETIEQYREDGFTKEFRLYDDDDELYYEGLMLDDAHEDDPFEPLDWAMGYAGCTRIDYLEIPEGIDTSGENFNKELYWEQL